MQWTEPWHHGISIHRKGQSPFRLVRSSRQRHELYDRFSFLNDPPTRQNKCLSAPQMDLWYPWTPQHRLTLCNLPTPLYKIEPYALANALPDSKSSILNSLADNNKVELRGFGTFGIKHRMPKKARNPGTGEAVFLPERFVPTFKPSKLMRSRVNDLIKKK